MKQLERTPHSAALLCMEGATACGGEEVLHACPHCQHTVPKERALPWAKASSVWNHPEASLQRGARPQCERWALSSALGTTGTHGGSRRLGMHPALTRVGGASPAVRPGPELWDLPPQPPTQAPPAPLTRQP